VHSVADQRLLAVAQVAEELQITEVTVRRWITSGRLRASKAGPRRWMVRRSDLDAFIASPPRPGDAPDADATVDGEYERLLSRMQEQPIQLTKRRKRAEPGIPKK